MQFFSVTVMLVTIGRSMTIRGLQILFFDERRCYQNFLHDSCRKFYQQRRNNQRWLGYSKNCAMVLAQCLKDGQYCRARTIVKYDRIVDTLSQFNVGYRILSVGQSVSKKDQQFILFFFQYGFSCKKILVFSN